MAGRPPRFETVSTKIGSELASLLKKLGISAPKQLMAVIEAAETHSPA
jgi:hypothetical protein